MRWTPIVPHLEADPSPRELQRVDRLAERLRREQPQLAAGDELAPLVPERLPPGPSLVLDDVTRIALFDLVFDASFLEDRGRLRAGDGDVFATAAAPSRGFERYCRERLDLGAPELLRPATPRGPLHLAEGCWSDEQARRVLVERMRRGGLDYLHPHLASRPVWETAARLSAAAGRPLRVIGPPPGLCRVVNDKLWLARVVGDLFRGRRLPATESAGSFEALAERVGLLAGAARVVVVKVPDSAGGAGNFVFEAAPLRGLPSDRVAEILRRALPAHAWPGPRRLLVSAWETEVLSSPSTQLWVPPMAEGPPILEGLYEQMVEGPQGAFVGARPARLPAETTRELATVSWLLARLFQRLGYVGRCSFDLLLVGPDLDRCGSRFVECNGRWGGTSVPMTLMNRLFGDWARRPYAVREIHFAGLESLGFTDLLEHFADRLYDAASGGGDLILYNPGQLAAESGITVLALGASWEAAARTVQVEIPRHLEQLAAAGVAG